MKEWLHEQIETGFSDFKGLSITGHIPVRDRLVNELLADALHGVSTPATAGGVDIRSFLKFIEKAEVHASDGVIAVDIVVRIE